MGEDIVVIETITTRMMKFVLVSFLLSALVPSSVATFHV